MTEYQTGLADLLSLAARADGIDRITYRDAIAAHGRPAVEAMRKWLDVPNLAAFAVRVIAAVEQWDPEASLEGLRAASIAATGAARTDAARILETRDMIPGTW